MLKVKSFSFTILLTLIAVSVVLTQGQSTNATDVSLKFDRVLIVVLENQPLKASMRNSRMRDVLNKGTLLVNYYGLTNPSQPNYIGFFAGDMLGVSGDGVYNLAQSNLVDLLEAKNVTWKSYQEHYPGNCFAGDTADGLYKRKHNPFISFDNIRNNPERCANIVEASTLQDDLKAGTVPQFSFYTPNMNNNGHDTGLKYAANWLHKVFLPTYLIPFNNTGNSLLVVTFDEGVPGDNQIYTLLIGPNIPVGHIDNTKTYNHYSLLRLVEENYDLGNLNRHDATAERITSAYFVKGTIHFADERLVLALSIGLPLIVVTILAIAGFTLYRRRVQKRRIQEAKEQEDLNVLLLATSGSEKV